MDFLKGLVGLILVITGCMVLVWALMMGVSWYMEQSDACGAQGGTLLHGQCLQVVKVKG